MRISVFYSLGDVTASSIFIFILYVLVDSVHGQIG